MGKTGPSSMELIKALLLTGRHMAQKMRKHSTVLHVFATFPACIGQLTSPKI